MLSLGSRRPERITGLLVYVSTVAMEATIAECMLQLRCKNRSHLCDLPWLVQPRGTWGIPGSHAASLHIPQHRTKSGTVQCQPPVRELTAVWVKPGLPSYFSLNGFTGVCVSLEFTVFHFV